jgi:hypothetical protein
VTKTGPVAHDLERRPGDDVGAMRVHLVCEDARDPAAPLPRELGLARPVAAQPDLDVPVSVDVAALDEPVHRRAVRALDAEDLRAGVGVRVEMGEPDRAVRRRDGAHVRLGDRVVAAEHDRHRARLDGVAHERLQGVERGERIRRDDRRIAEVHDPERGERVDPGLEVRARRAAGGTDRPRPEPRSRPVRHEVVERGTDDRDVGAGELGGALRVRHAREREQPGVVRLVRQPAAPPALLRVDHVRRARRPRWAARRRRPSPQCSAR